MNRNLREITEASTHRYHFQLYNKHSKVNNYHLVIGYENYFYD